MSHTPGPWVLELDPDGGFIITNGPAAKDGTWVLAARGPIAHRVEASRANARLIAAAPDLLEAASKLVMWVRHTVPTWTSEVDKYLEATEAAIAKAEGP